jgi:ABC-type Mn2+/Zn2+ transport system ATPase subunit
MSLIRLVNGGFRYPSTNKWIFRGLDFSVDAGEAVRLVGRNGSGKTTLLKVLCGILPLTEGQIHKQPRTCPAYMDQFAGEMLANDLTIAEQLKMATTHVNGVAPPGSELLTQFDVGLQNRTNEFIGHLSGGQRQVVALISTLAAGANLLCLDEFTSSMDNHATAVANGLLQHAQTTTGTASVLVSHSSIGTHVDREFGALVVEG